MPAFMKGRELSRLYYHEAIRPILQKYFPSVPHAAARIGGGSDVLGFDTAMSMDHDWGPRVKIFLREQDKHLANDIYKVLAHELPFEVHGFPVNYTRHADGTLKNELATSKPQNIEVPILTVAEFAQNQFDHEIPKPLTMIDWLTISSQTFAEVVYAAVHIDKVGELTALREQLTWYPHDIWLYLLASSWERLGQEEHLMPRTGFVGDELGSSVIGGRLVRDIMFLCFLMERHYAPYPKWFGSAFKQLKCADTLMPILHRVQHATTWQDREEALGEAYVYMAEKHNALNLTESMPTETSSFHTRPFQVLHAERFAAALLEKITDPEVKRIADLGMIGGIDHFSDSTNLRSYINLRTRLKYLYAE